MVFDLKAASRLGVSQSRAGKAERPTPGAGCEVLQSLGGSRQSLNQRERTAESGQLVWVKEKYIFILMLVLLHFASV